MNQTSFGLRPPGGGPARPREGVTTGTNGVRSGSGRQSGSRFLTRAGDRHHRPRAVGVGDVDGVGARFGAAGALEALEGEAGAVRRPGRAEVVDPDIGEARQGDVAAAIGVGDMENIHVAAVPDAIGDAPAVGRPGREGAVGLLGRENNRGAAAGVVARFERRSERSRAGSTTRRRFWVPSGAHTGSWPLALSTGAIALLPSAFVVQTCSSPLEKAILPPSGAQVGCSPGLAIDNGVSVEPSAATTKICR